MFDELRKYESNGHFFFSQELELKSVCNAPKNGIGIYIVYKLKNGIVTLVYIGASGKVKQNGEWKSRKGGIFDRLVNGNQFGAARRNSWKQKLIDENIEALDIYWFETFDNNHADLPKSVEGLVMQRFFDIHGTLPEWNKEY